MGLAELLTELLSHYAYDRGATDSGVRDWERRNTLAHLYHQACERSDYRVEEGRWFREHFLSEQALKAGYGLEDVMDFNHWLYDL